MALTIKKKTPPPKLVLRRKPAAPVTKKLVLKRKAPAAPPLVFSLGRTVYSDPKEWVQTIRAMHMKEQMPIFGGMRQSLYNKYLDVLDEIIAEERGVVLVRCKCPCGCPCTGLRLSIDNRGLCSNCNRGLHLGPQPAVGRAHVKALAIASFERGGKRTS